MELCREICLATRNSGKLQEIEGLLAAYDVTLRLISDFTDVEPVEDGGTYLANATLKAKAALAASGLPSLADDAGIEFAALPGRFGVETAPDAAALGGWEQAMQLVEDTIAQGAPATAHHHVTYVLALPDNTLITATGIVSGSFVHPPRGDDWGFNAFFIPNGQTETYAEIKASRGLTAKNALSARGLALQNLLAKLALAPKSP